MNRAATAIWVPSRGETSTGRRSSTRLTEVADEHEELGDTVLAMDVMSGSAIDEAELRDQASRLERMLDELLDYSRPVQLRLGTVTAREVAAQAERLTAAECEERGIRLDLDLPDEPVQFVELILRPVAARVNYGGYVAKIIVLHRCRRRFGRSVPVGHARQISGQRVVTIPGYVSVRIRPC